MKEEEGKKERKKHPEHIVCTFFFLSSFVFVVAYFGICFILHSFSTSARCSTTLCKNSMKQQTTEP